MMHNYVDGFVIWYVPYKCIPGAECLAVSKATVLSCAYNIDLF